MGAEEPPDVDALSANPVIFSVIVVISSDEEPC